jgi:hypothetical protein
MSIGRWIAANSSIGETEQMEVDSDFSSSNPTTQFWLHFRASTITLFDCPKLSENVFESEKSADEVCINELIFQQVRNLASTTHYGFCKAYEDQNKATSGLFSMQFIL